VLAARTRRICVILEAAQDPHNVHAVLRTAEALGIQDVHVVAPRGEAAAISPGVTQRAHEWLDVRRHVDIDAAVAVARAEHREVWAAAVAPQALPLAAQGHAPDEASPRIALVLGNETDGISPRAAELADRLVRIDLVGFSGSLNLSVAAAILLWHLRRPDLASGDVAAGDLGPDEREALRRRWYPALLGRPASDPAVAAWLARADEIRAQALAAEREDAPGRARG
jgi:tRNA (guanosine-2'-O-)-methyltransferase